MLKKCQMHCEWEVAGEVWMIRSDSRRSSVVVVWELWKKKVSGGFDGGPMHLAHARVLV